MKKLLYPLSLLYKSGSYLDKKFKKKTKLDIPVISIGNITWGGSGKTPVVIETAKYILSSGKTPVILTRGYGRKDKSESNVIVRNKEKILSCVEQSGDEPYMISQSVSCPVIVGADRVKSADIAKQFNPDVFILDDGFQHWRIKRNLDIVCVNACNPFGNGMLIPAGILRENKSSLKRAGLIILTNCNLVNKEKLESLKKDIKNICGQEPVCVSYEYNRISCLYNDAEISVNDINEKNIILLSAIGSPENFLYTAEQAGFKMKNKIIFGDHHKYTYDDIFNICKNMKDDDRILTTAKDAVKIKEILKNNYDMAKKIYVLNVSIKFDSLHEIFINKINNILTREK